MNSSQRRIFRRALSKSLGLSIGQSLTMNGCKSVGRIVAIAPNGKRDVHVKLKNNHVYAWPLKDCAIPLSA